MQKLILDPDLRTRLRNLTTEWEVCEETGRTLGYFLPADLYRELLYAWSRSQFANDEGLKQARQEAGGMTTTEAIAHLEAVARSARGGS